MSPRSKGLAFTLLLLMIGSLRASGMDCSCHNSFQDGCDCDDREQATHLRIKRQGYFCSEYGLAALQPPPYLIIPDPFTMNANFNGSLLRCAGGNVLTLPAGSPGFVTGGYFQVDCLNGDWVDPGPKGWPNATTCQTSGANCSTVPASSNWPTYLTPASNVTSVVSGGLLPFSCSDPSRVLSSPFSLECYDGNFVNTPFPDYDSCIDPSVCSITQLDTLVPAPPGHLKLVSGTPAIINNGGTINFTCQSGNFTPDVDPSGSNTFSVVCSKGLIQPPFFWPPPWSCMIYCTRYPVVPINSTAITTLPIQEEDTLTFECKGSNQVFNSTFMDTQVTVNCTMYGNFSMLNPMPACVQAPKCGAPTPPFSGSGLQLFNMTNATIIYSGQKAAYNCTDPTYLTDLGPVIEMWCVVVNGIPTFATPSAWETPGATCRPPLNCTTDPPIPPAANGLKLTTSGTIFVELSVANYSCSDPNNVFYWNGQTVPNMTLFGVACEMGGNFPDSSLVNWPFCDVSNPPKCSNYLPAPPGVPIYATDNSTVFPGGYAIYKCKDPTTISTMGEEIQVSCVKDPSGLNASFVAPIGWNQIRCEPIDYPKLTEPECYCLGDSRLSKDQSKNILDNACRPYFYNFVFNSMNTPLKQRCGVTDPENPGKRNICTCSESNDNAADFGIWSVVEITSSQWTTPLGYPSSSDFSDLELEFEKQIDERLIDYWKYPGWNFVRSKVMFFAPGQPQGCSFTMIPAPDDFTGLEILTQTGVPFGGNGEYICKNRSLVVNDGITFKLPCYKNGQFLRRPPQTCRERQLCSMLPPIPLFSSGLALSTSYNVSEFDFAIYKCRDPSYYVPNTIDGSFRVPCQKSGRFQPTTTFLWPNCTLKPLNVCSTFPSLPASYVQINPQTPYIDSSHSLDIRCVNSTMLAGNSSILSFPCAFDNTTGGFNFTGLNVSTLPACRPKNQCPVLAFPIPPDYTGLSQPYFTKSINELDYVDYNCFQRGSQWKLLGDYSSSEFSGDNVLITNGQLRIFCAIGAVAGKIRIWPTCRDSSITNCDPSDLTLAGTGLVASTTGFVLVGKTLQISCSKAGFVTNQFKSLTLTCGYDGDFDLPQVLSKCRAAAVCPSAPTPPATAQLNPPTGGALKEFDIQVYTCLTGFTLFGVSHPLVRNGVMELPCNLTNGTWALATSDWPICQPVVNACIAFDVATLMPGYQMVNPLPLNVGDLMTVQCATPGFVTSVGKTLTLPCTNSGNFQLPNYIPPCRPPSQCDPNPVPPGTVRLSNSTSGNLTEWDFAYYSCVPGSSFSPADYGSLVNGLYRLQCGLLGKFQSPTPWINCTITSCLNLPTIGGYNASTVAPVPVNATVNYTCSDPDNIPGNSDLPIPILCQPDGTFSTLNWPSCRPRGVCRPAPTPNITTTFLVNPSPAPVVKEFQYYPYNCKNGATLNTSTAPGVSNGVFYLQCPLGGTFPPTSNVPWPTCSVLYCVSHITSLRSYSSQTPLPLAVGKSADYGCTTANWVTNNGSTFPVVCGPNGDFIPPKPSWPTCRAALQCGTPPTPPASSNLQRSTAISVYEFSFANYLCRGDGIFTNSSGIVTNLFSVLCRVNASYDPAPIWPVCVIKNCLTVPTALGLTPNMSAPIPINTGVTYSCSTAGQVTPIGKNFTVTCFSNGTLTLPSPTPTCALPLSCPAPPVPPASTRLLNSTSSGLYQFDYAVYTCPTGMTLVGSTNPGVVGNTFQLQCGTSGTFPATPNWATCLYTSCLVVPSISGMTTTATSPLATGAQLNYTCNTAGMVTDYGPIFSTTCSPANGTVIIPTPAPSCRAPGICLTTPNPPGSTQLTGNTTSAIKEFTNAVFDCNTGYTLLLITNRADVYGGQFYLPCLKGAVYSGTPNWPTCTPLCRTLPATAPASVTPSTTTPNNLPGTSIQYSCAITNKVFNTSKAISLPCTTAGTFTAPATWPTCRNAISCTPPTPPAATHLKLATGSPSPLLEFSSAVYDCNTGFALTGASNFSAICPYGGGAFTVASWPTCTSTSGRKKRSVLFANVPSDVPYSVYVFFETQFMYTKGIESDIKSITNLTRADPIFPAAIIQLFHSRIQGVLQQGQLWRTTLNFPVVPLCEQPMNPVIQLPNCFKTNIASTCPGNTFNATWLMSMGYSMLKQDPNWLPDTSSSSALVPVGGAVYYYCSDPNKRPKLDQTSNQDGSMYNGIISTHCSHTGVLNISMNPSAWDQCRARCSVLKPQPPVIPDAQLQILWTDLKDIRINNLLWQDDVITYSCENQSLVLNYKKGVFTKIYTCQSDGSYSTPKLGDPDNSWPQCTNEPVDPIIIDAISLLSNTFAANIIYRYQSAESDGVPKLLDSQYALLHITLPAIIGLLLITFFIMCCTRSKSPICKIFEPQA